VSARHEYRPSPRQPSQATQRADQPRPQRRQFLLSASAVVSAGALGGWALLATRPKSPRDTASSADSDRAAAARSHPSSAARPADATVSITWVGDMTFGTLDEWPPDGTGSLITGMLPHLHSDLTIGNLETALGDLPMDKCTPGESDCYQFEAPDYTAKVLKRAGFHAVNVANNHTFDAGPAGEVSTNNALRRAGLLFAGRPGQITYLTRNGIEIALLGFAPWPYDASALDIPAAKALVREARRNAQVVIVMEHLGGEGDEYRNVLPGTEYFLGQDRGNSIAFTHGVIDAGADLVMGSGPHVLRGFQWYRGHLIAYSLGNFCGYYTLGLDKYTSVSAILRVTLNASGQFVVGSIKPIQLVGPGIPQVDHGGTAIRYINSISAAGKIEPIRG